MKLALELSLPAMAARGTVVPSDPPHTLALGGTHEVAEDEELGFVVGALTGVDPEGGSLTWSLVDGDGKFDVSGSNLIVSGVLDFESDTSHPVTVRATSSESGLFADLPVTITVTDVSETPPPENPPPDDGDIEDDGAFVIVPIVTVVDGGIKISGKKTALSAGKFIYDLGAAEADTVITMAIDPDFTLLTNQGKNAAVGFVFKQANDFHFVGNQGDGSTGLDAVQVSGDGLWNAGTGWTEDDAGAVTHGTQAGPNYVQIQISEDGSTYTYRTASDFDGPWTDEYTDEVPTPHADAISPAQFGIGAIFRANDTGNFSIKITQYVEQPAVIERQFMVATPAGAYLVNVTSPSRQVMIPGALLDYA